MVYEYTARILTGTTIYIMVWDRVMVIKERKKRVCVCVHTCLRGRDDIAAGVRRRGRYAE